MDKKKQARSYTQLERRLAVLCIANGMSLHGLSRKTGIPRKTISLWCERQHVKSVFLPKHQQYSEQQIKKAKRIVACGYNATEIAFLFECSKTTARRWLKKFPLEPDWEQVLNDVFPPPPPVKPHFSIRGVASPC